MREPGSGRILLISRAAAFTGGIAGPHYAASTAGLHATDPLPGLPARRNRDHGQRADADAGRRDQDAARPPGPAARQVPARRLGQPSQVAGLAAAILAKAYPTNQVISPGGGIYPRQAPDGIHHNARTSRPGSR